MAETKLKPEQSLSSTRAKAIQISRDISVASGNVGYTGVGFKPSAIILMAAVSHDVVSFGIVGTDKLGNNMAGGSTWNTNAGAIFGRPLFYPTSTGNYVTGEIASYDSDGFTMTWTKVGSPTGTLYVSCLCFR